MKRALSAAALALAMAATPGVAAAGPVWTVPQSITGESSASYPSISVAHNRTAMAVWRQSDGIGWSHWDGSTWSLAQVVGPAGASSPSIALSGDGTSAVLAWDHSKQVEVSRWDGTVWTPPVSVSGVSAGFPAPSALLDLDGDHPMVVWQMSAAGNYSLEYTRWNGTIWTSAATVIATSSVIPGTASAMNDNGQAVAVFASPGPLSFTVSAMSWNGSAWSAPTDLIGLRMTPLTSQPAAAISSQGSTSAGLWTATILAQSRVEAAVAGGSWPAPTDLVTGTEFAPLASPCPMTGPWPPGFGDRGPASDRSRPALPATEPGARQRHWRTQLIRSRTPQSPPTDLLQPSRGTVTTARSARHGGLTALGNPPQRWPQAAKRRWGWATSPAPPSRCGARLPAESRPPG